MTANEARKYLDGLDVERVFDITDLMSANKSKYVDQALVCFDAYFCDKKVSDQRLIALASFIQGIMEGRSGKYK